MTFNVSRVLQKHTIPTLFVATGLVWYVAVKAKRDRKRGIERERTGDCERMVGEREGDAKRGDTDTQ